jgi:hypothetical protein
VLTYAAAAVLVAAAAAAMGMTTLGSAHADHRSIGDSAAAGRAGQSIRTSATPAAARGSARRTAGPDGTARRAAPSEPSAAPSPAPAQPAAAEQPIQIYDSAAPATIPAGVMVATYATGKYAVPGAEMAGRATLWIDAWGTDPAASALDVEPGDATPSMVPAWVAQHLAMEPSNNARIYTFLDEWSAVQQAVSTLPSWMQARVRWWIADPTGVPHMVPGASATQWYWGPSYDISTAIPGF